MSDKTPQPGEFWEKENVRLRVVGSKRNGVIVGEHECGSICMLSSYHDWQRLPDCTGFDWEPETFPQWYLFQGVELFGSGNDRYAIRRTSKTYYEFVGLHTGEPCFDAWGESCGKAVSFGTWVKVTEEQARNALKPLPVESPNDWVVQDQCVVRSGIDQKRWVYASEKPASEWAIADGNWTMKHGDTRFWATLEVRCRRKDLPPLPNKFTTLANDIEQLRADMMRRCDELGVRLTELEEGGNG